MGHLYFRSPRDWNDFRQDLPEGRCRRDDERDIQVRFYACFHHTFADTFFLTLRLPRAHCVYKARIIVDFTLCACVVCHFPSAMCGPCLQRLQSSYSRNGWIIIYPPIVLDARGVHPGIVSRGAVPVDAQPLLPHIAI
ncbi:hypothetical protein CY34DRAFT_589218 [Suillus luteus UH-Slu-Lm8-n1]|uniref:Uncharacterized protein n=1 Tax=Suillus luteus UH-Slu-Lm8-n1 TaxID=930992 RepID=A0A0D0B4M3_9AGAM|nr:hypothetical protein CY34DRAFT_589218 [Suillus luteus UH-Slu-Lm8-n1]